jgi:hypothetical protein
MLAYASSRTLWHFLKASSSGWHSRCCHLLSLNIHRCNRWKVLEPLEDLRMQNSIGGCSTLHASLQGGRAYSDLPPGVRACGGLMPGGAAARGGRGRVLLLCIHACRDESVTLQSPQLEM